MASGWLWSRLGVENPVVLPCPGSILREQHCSECRDHSQLVFGEQRHSRCFPLGRVHAVGRELSSQHARQRITPPVADRSLVRASYPSPGRGGGVVLCLASDARHSPMWQVLRHCVAHDRYGSLRGGVHHRRGDQRDSAYCWRTRTLDSICPVDRPCADRDRRRCGTCAGATGLEPLALRSLTPAESVRRCSRHPDPDPERPVDRRQPSARDRTRPRDVRVGRHRRRGAHPRRCTRGALASTLKGRLTRQRIGAPTRGATLTPCRPQASPRNPRS